MRSSITAATALGVLLAAGAPVAAEEGWLKDPITGCEIWSAEAVKEGEGATWSGACQDGKISGDGVLTFWDATGLLARYDGPMEAGKATGDGMLRLRSENGEGFDRYIGTFEDGVPKGRGLVSTADGTHFFGELLDGINHARGTLRMKDGTVLRGEIKDGAAVGTVLVYYEPSEDEVFFGSYEEERRQGFGIHSMADGTIYHGEYDAGVPAGPGLIETEDGRRYMGMFADGLPDGPGTGVDADGNVLQGMFKAGKPEGTILATSADGTQTVETWKDGEKVQ